MGRNLPLLSVLFVVPYAPTRIRTRPFHMIRALTLEGHRLTVATVWGNEEERAALDALTSIGVAVVAEHLPRARPLWNCALAMLTADPLQAHYSWSPALAAHLARLMRDTPVDVVHVEHLRGVRYALAAANGSVPAGGRRVPVVWDSVDCISSLFGHAARQSAAWRVRLAARLELPRTERYEGRVTQRFDRVLVTSSVDRYELLELAGDKAARELAARLLVVPNGVDLEYFSPTEAPRLPMTLVMTGKMSYHANATAAVRFVSDVMPSVWANLPETRLLIVGKDPPPELKRLQDANGGGGRVVVTGTVEDIRPFLRSATLAVAPIQYGVGIQNKVLEALACGTPVVATPPAVSALAVRPGEGVVVSDTSRGLAGAIVALLGDEGKRREIGNAGRAYVARHHSWRHIAAGVADIYRGAIG